MDTGALAFMGRVGVGCAAEQSPCERCTYKISLQRDSFSREDHRAPATTAEHPSLSVCTQLRGAKEATSHLAFGLGPEISM